MAEIDPSLNWDDWRYFLAVVRHSSVRKAAADLSVSRSTVLRRIDALEQSLGARLFERLPNGYFTTPSGDDLMDAALRMEAAVNSVQRRVAGRDAELTGPIRITMPGTFATHLLAPHLAQFSAEHPNITLHLNMGYSMADLERREADIAIRVSNDPPADLVGRRVLTMARAAYISKALYKKSKPKDAATLKWIGWGHSVQSPQWLEETDHPNLPIGAIIEDPHATFEAVKAGMGLAVLPCYMGDNDPALQRMPPGNTTLNADLWVLTHEDLRKTARIRKFMTFIAEALLAHRPLIEGREGGA